MTNPAQRVACLDVGSTFTKGVLVDVAAGAVVASDQRPTTSGTDVLDGVGAVRAALGGDHAARACSSAGGGLRLAVVGYERVVTAEAGYRAGLSAGARVVHVAAGPLDAAGLAALADAQPDLVLLVGGTDGGNVEVLLHNAGALGRSRLRAPVVVAGNAAGSAEAARLLGRPGREVVVTANVLPAVGVLAAEPARAAIRDAFVRHVIGGKGLTRDPDALRRLVSCATPDAVLGGVQVLGSVAGDVLVVDVGGATTDVYSVLDPADAGAAPGAGDVAGTAVALRTVEGDLGVRVGAPGVVEAAGRERLLGPGEDERLSVAARRRHDEPAWLPTSAAEVDDDRLLARLAATVAVRRHARGGRDLRRVRLVVGSGGVLRRDVDAARALLAAVVDDRAGGWRLPERATLAVDIESVLAPVGLLAADHPDAAVRLAATLGGGEPRR